jgi:putative membrane protein insertion efficiency factor
LCFNEEDIKDTDDTQGQAAAWFSPADAYRRRAGRFETPPGKGPQTNRPIMHRPPEPTLYAARMVYFFIRVYRAVNRTLVAGALGAIRAYQLMRAAAPHSCRFYPTCSAYAADAIKRHGVCRGAIKALKRIVRCSPLSPGGYDPVL